MDLQLKYPLKFDMLMYRDHFGTDYIWVMVCWFSSFWRHFDLEKRVKCGVSRHFRDNVCEEWVFNLWYPQKLKKQILAHGNYPATKRRVSLTTVKFLDFLVGSDTITSEPMLEYC